MANLEKVINVLTEISHLDSENQNAKISICRKYLLQDLSKMIVIILNFNDNNCVN